jgi:hypothetical protein
MGVKVGTIGASGIVTASQTRMNTGFNLSLSGFGSATIALQRSFDNGDTWLTIEAFTADTEKLGESHESALYRLNATAYSSGTIAYRISG